MPDHRWNEGFHSCCYVLLSQPAQALRTILARSPLSSPCRLPPVRHELTRQLFFVAHRRPSMHGQLHGTAASGNSAQVVCSTAATTITSMPGFIKSCTSMPRYSRALVCPERGVTPGIRPLMPGVTVGCWPSVGVLLLLYKAVGLYARLSNGHNGQGHLGAGLFSCRVIRRKYH